MTASTRRSPRNRQADAAVPKAFRSRAVETPPSHGGLGFYLDISPLEPRLIEQAVTPEGSAPEPAAPAPPSEEEWPA